MATSGRYCIFFEAPQSRVLVLRVLHDRMDYRRHPEASEPTDEKV
jgi:plasmid stabilization system protein ParE